MGISVRPNTTKASDSDCHLKTFRKWYEEVEQGCRNVDVCIMHASSHDLRTSKRTCGAEASSLAALAYADLGLTLLRGLLDAKPYPVI
jgi:hypothetical protein